MFRLGVWCLTITSVACGYTVCSFQRKCIRFVHLPVCLNDRQIEEVLCENRELIHRLTVQEEELNYSGRRLQQRSDECQTVNRQLQTALTDLKQQVELCVFTHCHLHKIHLCSHLHYDGFVQVWKVKEKTCGRESVLQAKLKQLEAEKMRREKELQQLKQIKLSVSIHLFGFFFAF